MRVFCTFFLLFFILEAFAEQTFVPSEDNDSAKTRRELRRAVHDIRIFFADHTLASTGFECRFHVPPPDGQGNFAFKRIQNDVYEISFPPKADDWMANRKLRNRLIRYLISARLSSPLEQSVLLPESWVFAALAKQKSDNMGLPIPAKYPGAYAMASHGYIPSLMSIILYPVDPENSAVRELYEEWCAVLYEILLRKEVIKRGAGKAYLQRLFSERHIGQDKLFQEIFVPVLAAENDKEKFDVEEWFSEMARKYLLSRLFPASAAYLEKLFHSAVKTGSSDGLAELLNKKEPLLDEEKLQLSAVIFRITQLSMIAPPELSEALQKTIYPIGEIRNTGLTEKAKKKYFQAEQNLMKAFENRLEIEKKLRDAERRFVQPGARHFISTEDTLRDDLPPILKAAETLLLKKEMQAGK